MADPVTITLTVPVLRILEEAKAHKYALPGIQQQPWGFRELSVVDPFDNRLIFCEAEQLIVDERDRRS